MDPKVKALLNLASEKISAARGLEKLGFHRDAISRAYYGMYHAAQALLLASGKKAIGHAGTISAFNHYFVKRGKISPKYTKWFSALKESREFADYESFKTFGKKEVEEAVKEAEEFIGVVSKLIKS